MKLIILLHLILSINCNGTKDSDLFCSTENRMTVYNRDREDDIT